MSKKTLIVMALLISSLSIAAWAFNPINVNVGIPNGIFRVDVGPQHAPHTTMHNLQDRVWHLEKAVAQLQDTVYKLKREAKYRKPVRKYSCYLETNFYGTFTAKGMSKNEAKGKVLQACNDKGGGIFCKSNEVKCD